MCARIMCQQIGRGANSNPGRERKTAWCPRFAPRFWALTWVSLHFEEKDVWAFSMSRDPAGFLGVRYFHCTTFSRYRRQPQFPNS